MSAPSHAIVPPSSTSSPRRGAAARATMTTTTNDENEKSTARVAVVVHLRVIGMMCQRNCGSTVRRALLGVDLSDLVGGASVDVGDGAPSPLNARVIDAMADHATSYARVVVEWIFEGGSSHG